MKLHFHGAEYEHSERHLPAQDYEVEGRYRGSVVKIHRHKIQARRQQNLEQDMIYRGVHYQHH